MAELIDFVGRMLASGAGNLAAYLAAHVLLCLLPAFLIAGAMSALIPKAVITRYLGRNRSGLVSYPASAAAGFLLAVCSCTVIPLFAGIYKKGAGLGPAITFLFVAPAVNIMAISYTGKLIGMDLAIARLVLSIVFGIGIGVAMSAIFHKDDSEHDEATNTMFAGETAMSGAALALLVLLVGLLLVGTFQLDLLTSTRFQFHLPVSGTDQLQERLHAMVPFDAAKGEEGVSVQGAMLIALLSLLGIAAWKGFEKAFEGFTKITWLAIGLCGLTLIFASLGVVMAADRITLLISGKAITVSVIISLLGWVFASKLTSDERQNCVWESWRFVKQIFPLLTGGVFLVGMIREVIQPQWVQSLAGENTVAGNSVGVVFGIFMYFPTLVEVPVAQMFLNLGMHRGPLLAYLMSDPELSLQSIMITASIIGKKKTFVYVGLVAVASTLAGLLYGAWVDSISGNSVSPALGTLLSCSH